jgi:hypothetical protein
MLALGPAKVATHLVPAQTMGEMKCKTCTSRAIMLALPRVTWNPRAAPAVLHHLASPAFSMQWCMFCQRSHAHLRDVLGVGRCLDGVAGGHGNATGALLHRGVLLQLHVALHAPGAAPAVLHQPVRLARLILRPACPQSAQSLAKEN